MDSELVWTVADSDLAWNGADSGAGSRAGADTGLYSEAGAKEDRFFLLSFLLWAEVKCGTEDFAVLG